MDRFMKEAFLEALAGRSEGGIPIGSVIVHDGQIIGRGHNQRIQKGSVIRHAEMDAFENAGRQDARTYRDCTLYTTLSPCPMCTGAILLYGIRKVIIGENINFTGAEDLLTSKGVVLEILNDPECITMMKEYIRDNPHTWNEDIGQ